MMKSEKVKKADTNIWLITRRAGRDKQRQIIDQLMSSIQTHLISQNTINKNTLE